MKNSNFLLEMNDIIKTFPGVVALDKVQLKVNKGTAHGLVGENGAGKSTLMKVLLGIHKQNSGNILFKGEKKHFKGPSDALNSGIAMIHQELSTAQDLTIAENIFLGKEVIKKKILLNEKKMIETTRELLDELSMDLDPETKMKNLSMADRQMCEIAKALSYKPDLIIMDEPTSAIAREEINRLFKIINKLKDRGITIIYISHKLDEIFEITDRITVLRDGQYVDTVITDMISDKQLVAMMVGREINQMFPKLEANIGEEIFRVEGLSDGKKIKNVSFSLKSGEILGVAGLVGSGRTEIMELIFGVRPKTKGDIYLNNKKINITNPREAIDHGIAFLTEDRKDSGCFLPLNICLNTCITILEKSRKEYLLNPKKINSDTEDMRTKLNIKTTSIEQKIVNLSGGNQQKVLIARWLLSNPDILILDEPTRGIDVNSKSEIYRLISQLAQSGKSIIMISSEMPEILGMSDRIMVVNSGEIAEILDIQVASQEKILTYAAGTLKKQSGNMSRDGL